MAEIIKLTTPEIGSKLSNKLDVNSSSTVQALAMLRIGVFIPIRRNLPKNNKGELTRPAFRTDISDEFRKLEFARTEGFEKVAIQGPALNFETDFKSLLSPFLMAIPAQLLAYHVANERGTDVDQPRNLAKSVTVE